MISPITIRHPELVSGSIFPLVQVEGRQSQPSRKIDPVRVLALDEVDLPWSMPPLQLLLAKNGTLHIAEHLEPDEHVDLMLSGKAGNGVVTMLPKPGDKVGSDADVERSERSAGEDVDAGAAFVSHDQEFAARWTLKQVQGDEDGLESELVPDACSECRAR